MSHLLPRYSSVSGLKAAVARNRTVELAPVMPQTGITLPLASNGTVIQYLDKGCVTVNPLKISLEVVILAEFELY